MATSTQRPSLGRPNSMDSELCLLGPAEAIQPTTRRACGCARPHRHLRGGGALRGVAVHALLSAGPSAALGRPVAEVSQKSNPGSELPSALPLGEELKENRVLQGPMTPHRGSQHSSMWVFICGRGWGSWSAPGGRLGGARGECAAEEEKEQESIRSEVLSPELWDCLSPPGQVAGFRYTPVHRRRCRYSLQRTTLYSGDEFVRRLTEFGPVFFNKGSVAHVGVSAASDAGRLPTMAEFFLLGNRMLLWS